MKFSESVCVALVASLTEEMTAQSIAYHAHGTADGDKSCCYSWLVCQDIKSVMHCSLRLAPTMINHLTSIIGASLSESHTSVTALRTRVSIYTYVYLWTDHLPEILNLRITKFVRARVHFKFKFDSENDHGVLTIFLNDSGSTECEREIASCSQTVQLNHANS